MTTGIATAHRGTAATRAAASGGRTEQVIVTSAQETFAAYDTWMRGWKAASAGTGVSLKTSLTAGIIADVG